MLLTLSAVLAVALIRICIQGMASTLHKCETARFYHHGPVLSWFAHVCMAQEENSAKLARLMYSSLGDGKQPVPAECFALGKFRHLFSATFGWLFFFGILLAGENKYGWQA
ncbi:hypothetical protein K931_01679 [Aeromonas salmonicida subsp. pectinolytica 34mel]|nr:hypothetical protein K931_01679 [Aeromonas salmonicida subsp. pectinolytica 34mel]